MKRGSQTTDRAEWKSVLTTFAVVFLVLFTYAIVRYNVIKGVDAAYIPLYISNKAIAVTATILIGLSYLMGPLARFWPKTFAPKLPLRKHFGLFGFGLAVVHGIISLLLFNPSYYPKFFTEVGKLTIEGELSMLFGIIALFIFSIVAITSIPSVEKSMNQKKWLFVQRLGYLAFALVLFHVLFMGVSGWLRPETWPGGLLPMSLISFVIIAFVLLMRLIVLLSKRR